MRLQRKIVLQNIIYENVMGQTWRYPCALDVQLDPTFFLKSYPIRNAEQERHEQSREERRDGGVGDRHRRRRHVMERLESGRNTSTDIVNHPQKVSLVSMARMPLKPMLSPTRASPMHRICYSKQVFLVKYYSRIASARNFESQKSTERGEREKSG